MVSSSHNTFEGVDDDNFDQYHDQHFDQSFENFTNVLGDQGEERKRKKKRIHIERNREEDNVRLWNDYFSETPTYPANLFRRRFRMNRPLFMRIVHRLSNEVFDKRKMLSEGLVSLPFKSVPQPFCLLAYGSAADTVDEYLRLGSIDCMHWEWKNCPTAWKGTLNDINVLDRSPVFDDIIEGKAPPVTFSVNGREYHLAYYLTDGIYPKWVTFIQSIPLPQGPKAALFAQHQEAVRKDVERAFGVLQARFAIVKNPSFFWDKVKIGKIMRACIILHNMIVEDERDGYTQYDVSEFQQGEFSGSSHVDLDFSTDMPTNIANIMGVRTRIRDRQMHQQLKHDLVEHLWTKFGRDEDNN
uniref:DDE Tnp4 domain-containing protein n=1 Tax=Brassica oleracea var. oleracea TaxID=109376 RepID=A0A0D3AXG9_BRAOL